MRRRFQFSIRNAFVLIGWIAVACVVVPAAARWNRSYWERRGAFILPPSDAAEFGPPPMVYGPIEPYPHKDWHRE